MPDVSSRRISTFYICFIRLVLIRLHFRLTEWQFKDWSQLVLNVGTVRYATRPMHITANANQMQIDLCKMYGHFSQ